MKDIMNWFNPLGKESSFLPDDLMDMGKMNDFVQKSIQDALTPKDQQKTKQPSSDYKVVELMREVVVTIPVPYEVDVEEIRLSVGSGKLFVSGIWAERMEIALPVQTSRRNGYAQYQNGAIEVRLQKKSSDEKEIFLHY
ncbi:Hsp20/alpha crystallin family protein [Halobacillus sp. Nhm2S1]|uniref:Hsp20/alpha crystallin family protein n=1 Tax=Halobacillus sp. Nhm2S1 TaxID=2866716 RepID=UPI001C736AD0|nr:Hsp20/alpha crystallin family protein [Halobacillus sp. Nhm2S1]MBX0357827.1 Hsp20/alpha crystallin family protein [Halobacillus sp. Nhm2S1]